MPSTWNVERIFDAGGPPLAAIGAYAAVQTAQSDASQLAASVLPSALRLEVPSSTAAKDEHTAQARFSSVLVVLKVKPLTECLLSKLSHRRQQEPFPSWKCGLKSCSRSLRAPELCSTGSEIVGLDFSVAACLRP